MERDELLGGSYDHVCDKCGTRPVDPDDFAEGEKKLCSVCQGEKRAWLAAEEQRLLKWPREKLIGWLQWNDGNGIWSDEDCALNDMDPMSVEDAVDQIMQFVREDELTPEEMMTGSLASNPGRYPKPEEFDPFVVPGAPWPGKLR